VSLSPVQNASPLDHRLQPHLEALAAFESTAACEASDIYRRLRPEIDRVLGNVESGTFHASAPSSSASGVNAVAWNLERGIRLDGIIEACLREPSLASADVWMLTEIDYGMARTANRHVARELAAGLGLNYVFAPCYLALNKGAGVEAEAEGDNTLALHGNALMSRFPLDQAHALALPNGKDKMAGREKRLGSQRAVIADVLHPSGRFRAVSLHLDAHSSQRHRQRQMRLLLEHLDRLRPDLPAVIGGDWNTTTHDASRALYSILGYARRVLMGVDYVLREHYPYPERWFERHLFRELEARGYEFRTFNVPGGCTLDYSIRDLAANRNMAEWIPNWCFWFIDRALEGQGGRCSMKLDWFAGRGLSVEGGLPGENPEGPRILRDPGIPGAPPLSDHAPIVLGFALSPRSNSESGNSRA
jgi:endonuclease/exonuclease/phosphatase family metal-dependent hydrolase